MKNKRIRLKLLEFDMTQYDLSKLLGISETTLYRRLREELSDEETREIIKIIEERGEKHE